MNRFDKVHLSRLFNGPARTLLLLIGLAFLVVGSIMVYFSISLGWLTISIGIYPIMLIMWYRRSLKDIPIDVNDRTFIGWTTQAVLSRLPKKPSPLDFANALNISNGGDFFRYRFGISPESLTGVSSGNAADFDKFWQVILEVMHDTNSPEVSEEVIATALIKNSEHADLLIVPMLLDMNDLYAGIRWRNHLKLLSKKSTVFRKTGGIARDWSFGWTPKLSRYGINLSLDSGYALPTVDLSSREQVLSSMLNILGSGSRRNVALTGATGVGKTSILRDFGDRLMDGSTEDTSSNLVYHQLILLDAATLIADCKGRGELEALLGDIFTEAFAAKNIILGFDNAHLFFEEGNGSFDASNMIKPILEHGSLPVVLVFNDQKFSSLVAKNPDLSNLINRITIQPPSEMESLIIMQDAVLQIEFEKKVIFMYQALKEAYDAGLRYVTDASMPAQAVLLLQDAANYAKDGLVTAQSVRSAVEAKYGIKMGVADDAIEKQKLLKLEQLIHERMINQTTAVSAVSEALRRARAGVRNEKKPIGTFLFIGPTGVGKTELAKSLASAYFGGEDSLVRVDLNEYVTEKDVLRLIEDAGSNPSSLTAQVLRRPFSVILLDEIEKAHPKVLSTLLQMLDEGLLIDEKNKQVSFRDAIIIATSNAGADRVREYVNRGLDVTKLKRQFIDELISIGDFSPEFLNRFDEIIMFTPLSPEDLLKVIDIIIRDINVNLEKQKISVHLNEEARKFLVEKGNDPVFGARPIKRIIQKVVENIVANKVLSGQIQPGQIIEIGINDMVNAIK